MLSAITACALLVVSCKEDGAVTVSSLKVSSNTLSFAAVGAEAQQIEVDAVDVVWDILLDDKDKVWLLANRNGDDAIEVSVENNISKEVRTGSITVYAPDNVKVDPQIITVTQSGAGEDVNYSLSVEPSVLKFGASDNDVQEAVVTVEGEGLTWSAAIDGNAEWIDIKVEGDKIRVDVEDNTETKERVASVNVVPDMDGVEAKILRVQQEAYVVPPSLKTEFTGNPVFPANAKDVTKTIYVESVNLKWDVRVEDENGEARSWLKATPMTEGFSVVDVKADNNTELTPREAYVVVFAPGGEVEPVRYLFSQEAAKEHISTLTGDVDLNGMVNSRVVVSANGEDEAPEEAVSGWDIRLWTKDIEYRNSAGRYFGTGAYIHLMIFGSYTPKDPDDNYKVPAGEYTVKVCNLSNGTPNTVMAGKESNNLTFPMGSWYVEMNDNAFGLAGPIVSGTVNISYEGDDHVLDMNLQDDLGNSLIGVYKGQLDFR